jgi:hypothetical protein
MADVPEQRESLRERTLEACYDEYKELVNIWRNIDSKAQANITVAGIFLAGAFAYLSKVSHHPDIYEQVFFVFAIVFLIISIVLSIMILKIRDLPHPPLGEFLEPAARLLLALNDADFTAYMPGLFNSHADAWTDTKEQLRAANRSKAELLWAAQVFLIIAIAWAALLFILKMIFS